MQMSNESASQAVIGKVKMFQVLLFLDQASPDLAECHLQILHCILRGSDFCVVFLLGDFFFS